ncbi:nucleotidyltransferase family protein [Cellulomonas sp. Y8]|uniref:nucleotidyltransferase family protein n=1 Tax=Cellulomonas sp. Y8 TaxID=2591145 RepID=UPI0011CC71CC|nr:nucleotidyltransferase family protein [Cellulomonas sp. Y8]
MVQLDDILRDAIAAYCRRYRFARLDVFGSEARDEATADSDVDVLYDLVPGRHLSWEVVDAADDLARILGRPVDLVSRRALHPLLRDQVEAEARPLSAA